MRVHYIKVESAEHAGKTPRATIGGQPILPDDQPWPTCRLCKAEMIFFFQFDLQKNFDLPLKSLSHLLVFMCPIHNDIPTQLVEGNEQQLPEEYWRKSFGHYALLLNKPGAKETARQTDEHIAKRVVTFSEAEEDVDWDGHMERGTAGFKVGGVPHWHYEAEYTRCACGAEMIFLCQLPAGFSFPTRKSAPEQPDTAASKAYQLFLGRPTYIFACKVQCTAYSLYAVTQDTAADRLAEPA
jgi:hypothetical protein